MDAKEQSAKFSATVPQDEATGESLDHETRRNVLKVAEIEENQRANRTTGERIAELIARFCGSMVFVYVHVVWFSGWIIVNSLSNGMDFDPFPYTFLTLVVSLEAIFLSTFILISQNQETKLAERRNHLDLQINMLSEQENTKMLELLQRIAIKVGIPNEDAETAALLEPMDPRRLVEEIVDATEGDSGKHQNT